MRTIGPDSAGLRRVPRTLPAVITLSLLALAGGGSARAAASAAQLMTAPATVRAGSGAEFIVGLENVPSCTVSVPGADQTVDTRDGDRVAFSFSVRSDAKTGPRTVSIDCSGAPPVSFSLTVLQPVERLAGQSWPVTDTVYYSVHRPLATTQKAWAYAENLWNREGSQFLAGFRNGQCTDLAARKRPDIVQRVYEASVSSFVLAQPFPNLDFTARNWAGLARAAGFVISPRPAAGAIVVWQPGVEGAGAGTGHVGYVTSIGHGTFTTVEENVGRPYAIGHRTLSTAPVAGRVFIYSGEATAAPTA